MSLNNSYEEADPAQPGNVHGYEIQDVDVREDPVQEPPEQPAEKKSRFKNPFKRSKKDKIIEPEDGPDPYHEPEPDQEPDDEVQKSDKKSKNKLKGLFKKKKKTATDDSSETRQTELVEPEETEENGMHDTSRHSQASGEATPVKVICLAIPDSRVHGANMGPTWGRQDPGGPHGDHVNLAIWTWEWLTLDFEIQTKNLRLFNINGHKCVV